MSNDGLALERNTDGRAPRFAIYVNGSILRTPKRGVVRWFRTQAMALRAGFAKKNERA
jgi:hypothetical protein